jgi:hypothetical protein
MESVAVKITKITVETETLMIVRRAKVALARCPGCRMEVEVITLDGDGSTDPSLVEQIGEWANTGKLHCWRTADGVAQICMPSLLHCLDLEDVANTRSAKESPLDLLRRKQ